MRLFRLSQDEVEIKAKHLVTCNAQLQDAKDRLLDAQKALRESAEADAVKEVKEEIKSIRETANALIADLDSECIVGVEA